jgi:hypothetical protein
MCLVFAGEPTEKEGIGYKFCRKEYINGEVFYRPSWSEFYADGTGGCNHGGDYHKERIIDNTIYKIGEKFVVEHSRKARDINCLAYHVKLRCKYEKVVAEDHETVVAMEMTPIEEMVINKIGNDSC